MELCFRKETYGGFHKENDSYAQECSIIFRNKIDEYLNKMHFTNLMVCSIMTVAISVRTFLGIQYKHGCLVSVDILKVKLLSPLSQPVPT